MTDNEIIKAFDVCVYHCCSEECPFYHLPDCKKTLLIDVHTLINRQKAEIEGLQRRIVFWKEDLNYNPKKERAEAIKGFAERLKKEAVYLNIETDEKIVFTKDIDAITKETTGEINKNV